MRKSGGGCLLGSATGRTVHNTDHAFFVERNHDTSNNVMCTEVHKKIVIMHIKPLADPIITHV